MLSKKFIITFFRQGEGFSGGNCASVALLKSALGKFGMDIVQITDREDGFSARLKDKRVIKISNKEYLLAHKKSGFVLKNKSEIAKEYFEYLQKVFAVMVKVYLKKNPYLKNYNEALYELSGRQNTDKIDRYLGLKKYYSKPLTKDEDISTEKFDKIVNSKKHLLLYEGNHAVYASEGYYDNYGEMAPFKNNTYEFKYLKYFI